MIVECAGLPGGGKTTICNLVAQPHGKRGAIRIWEILMNPALFKAAWKILLLCCVARPFAIGRLKRGAKMVLFLRHYQYRERAILLDQGQIQKIWSILVDAEDYSSKRVQDVMAALKSFAPDCVIWVETPVALAADRVIARTHGKSRYDRLSPESTQALLSARADLLRDFAQQYCLATQTKFIQLNGVLSPKVNAMEIDALFGPCN
jgi:hypothetical protein